MKPCTEYKERFVVGVDEAGRGPVCGPLVYGIAYMPVSLYKTGILKRLGVDDSKKVTEEKRTAIFEHLKKTPGFFFDTRVISATEISASMLQPRKVSLNVLSYAAARSLLESVCQQVDVECAYIDLVSPASAYEAFIRQTLPSVPLKIEAKADANYEITGAASICAKVTRDAAIRPAWGSGYPSDPNTKKYLKSACDNLFGFPDHVRHSWETVNAIYSDGTSVIPCAFVSDYERRPLVSANTAVNAKRSWYLESLGLV